MICHWGICKNRNAKKDFSPFWLPSPLSNLDDWIKVSTVFCLDILKLCSLYIFGCNWQLLFIPLYFLLSFRIHNDSLSFRWRVSLFHRCILIVYPSTAWLKQLWVPVSRPVVRPVGLIVIVILYSGLRKYNFYIFGYFYSFPVPRPTFNSIIM